MASEDGPTGHPFEVSHSRCQQGHGMRGPHMRFRDPRLSWLQAGVKAWRAFWKFMGHNLKFCLCYPLPRRGGSSLLCSAREDPTGNTQQGQGIGHLAGRSGGSGGRRRVQVEMLVYQTAFVDRDLSPWGKCRDSAAEHKVQEGLSHRQ